MGNKKHQPSGFFALRTALLPFETLTEWCKGTGNPTDQESFQKASSILRTRLQSVIARPEIREALYVASTSLDESIKIWEETPESERGHKIEGSIVRYLLRMAARSTPFGLFAGGSTGKISRHTRIELAPLPEYQRHTRLDMYYLCALTEKLKTDPRLRDQLVYRPNSSLYHAAGRYRYAEARMEERSLSYFLVGVDPTDYLTATLQRAGKGAVLKELAEPLVGEEISIEEATEYIGELIESQILIPDLEPNVTGAEPIHGLIQQLKEIPDARSIAEKLDGIRLAIEEIDNKGLGNSTGAYHAVESGLKELPAEVVPSKLFQVDMIKPVREATLGQGPLSEIQKGIELLHRLSPPVPSRTVLSQFQQAFQSRYEDREVDLVEALDNENGIGLEQGADLDQDVSPLLDGLPFAGGGGESSVSWSAREEFLFRKLETIYREKGREWKLSKEDQETLSSDNPGRLPDAFNVMARLIAPSEEAIAKGNYQVLFENCGGPSGARIFGRFCHGDKELLEVTREHLRAEEACIPDAIFAEICYLPEGRVGNIQLRPVLRKHEIPYLGKSGAPLEDQIPVTDLAISVRAGRVVLRSKRLNKEVIPRMTTAHNYSLKSTAIYRFLCMLQGEGAIGGVGWSWGPFDGAPFLPRVTAGRLILWRASWNIPGKDLKPIGKKKGYERFAEVQELRRKLDFPRFVLLADGDNELTVDLDNVLCVDTFVDMVKNRGGIRLYEMVPGPEDLFVRGPEGSFVHELAIPFVKGAEKKETKPAPVPMAQAVRRFPPGSEWLYFKVYGGHSSSDDVLREVIRPVVDKATQTGAADRWFFIRYGDPDWHIRFRFHGDPARLMSEIFPLVQEGLAPLIEENRAYKVQLDTYEREVERYGGEVGIELAEKIFCADSDAILSIVDSLSGDEGSDARWRLAVPGCDRILTDLGFDLKAKIGILKGMKDSWAREFKVDSFFRKKLGEKYRKEEEDLMVLLSPRVPEEHWLLPGIDLFKVRSEKIAPLAEALREAEKKGLLPSSLENMAGSFLHMHNNRLIASSQRAHEVVLYDFLFRAYQRMNAQQKRTGR
jgi:thiopeptide-type bacteriocin biosynthesis protein